MANRSVHVVGLFNVICRTSATVWPTCPYFAGLLVRSRVLQLSFSCVAYALHRRGPVSRLRAYGRILILRVSSIIVMYPRSLLTKIQAGCGIRDAGGRASRHFYSQHATQRHHYFGTQPMRMLTDSSRMPSGPFGGGHHGAGRARPARGV